MNSKPMQQPDELKTDDIYPAAEGRGNEVWSMLKAAADGDLASVQQLAAGDPSLLTCGGYYRTPLEMAVLENQFEVVKFLIEHGVDAASRRWRERPLLMARDRGYLEICELLETHFEEKYGIHPVGDDIAAAMRDWDKTKVRSLVDATPGGAHAADEYGNRPIHWAVLTRQLDVIDWLLDKDADINAVRPNGARPIDLTPGDNWYRSWYRDGHPDALQDDAVLVGYLIARGAEYNIVAACRVGDLGRVRTIVAESPEQVNGASSFSSLHCRLPISTASREGRLDIVKFLLSAGADPNRQETGAPYGAALHSAAWHNHLEVAKTLLEAGANPNQEVDSCVNCLLVAQTDEMRELLKSHGATFPLWHIAREGLTELMTERLASDPSLANDIPVFVEAAAKGNAEMTQIFLEYEPDLWQRMPAFAADSKDKTEWLFEQGMEAETANYLGVTALHGLAGSGNLEAAEIFLRHGADINCIDFECKSTPIGYAAKEGQTDMVKFLLEKGADRLAAGADWATPVRWAERRGQAAIVRILNS